MRRRREKIETRAKITVSDVKNMENIAKFTKKCIKNRAEGAIFFGFGQISKKPPPSFSDLSNKGGGFLLTIPLIISCTMYMMFLVRVPVCKTNTFGRKVRRRREKNKNKS